MAKRLLLLGLALGGVSVLLLAGCSDHGADPASPGPGVEVPPVSFALEIQPIFDQNCLDCHGAGGNAGLDLRPGFAYDHLVGIPAQASAGNRVVAGTASESVIIQRLTGSGLSQMPPEGSLGFATIELVRRWIDEGAEEN